MFLNKVILFILLLFFITTHSLASIKENIIQNLKEINNVTFNFEQNINGEVENGTCTIEYSKKIFCKYNTDNEKILVSNGKSLVIKTLNSYYIYPIDRTPLNSILDKKFLLSKINNLNERVINNQFINFSFIENGSKINIFFDKKSYNLIGWQTLDLYQNLSITYLNSIIKNRKLKKNFFKIPTRD
tara:strand:+ start:125 stop:682 length:558 start_codon:yes stop_codon:yes gene_type:complete